jgi:hypothetical protein
MIDYFFTSISNSYLPKARVLARSIRRHYPGVPIALVLSDERHPRLDYTDFDLVLRPEDLGIEVDSFEAWVFSHTIVELCTAVKPFAFRRLFERGAECVVYLDPDILLLSQMTELEEALAEHPIVVTPHVSTPAQNVDDLIDGEMLGSLRHGVFNLGFLALRNEGEGAPFLQWWLSRCRDYCFDDASRGLFTDQRWIDLAPCFFETLKILRTPSYNVASWNLYYRDVSRAENGELVVNGNLPLRFFHFSGLDIGTHEMMLKKHARGNRALGELTADYLAQVAHLANAPGVGVNAYDRLAGNRAIPNDWRRHYRSQPSLQQTFPAPYGAPKPLIDYFESDKHRRGPRAWLRSGLAGLQFFVRSRPTLARATRRLAPPRLVAWLRRAWS